MSVSYTVILYVGPDLAFAERERTQAMRVRLGFDGSAGCDATW
jgi:hypothetical protein